MKKNGKKKERRGLEKKWKKQNMDTGKCGDMLMLVVIGKVLDTLVVVVRLGKSNNIKRDDAAPTFRPTEYRRTFPPVR